MVDLRGEGVSNCEWVGRECTKGREWANGRCMGLGARARGLERGGDSPTAAVGRRGGVFVGDACVGVPWASGVFSVVWCSRPVPVVGRRLGGAV